MVDEVWDELRRACERLEPGAELVTPVSDRRFAVGATYGDRIVVRFRDNGEERLLERDGFEALTDRLEEESIPVETLAPGVEPYAVLLTITGTYVVDADEIEYAPPEAREGESPYLVPPEEARTRPERVRDDAVLLADLLERLDADAPSSLDTDSLADLYVLLSDVQRGSDRLRGTAGDALLERLGPDQHLSGRFGTVTRATQRYRRTKDDERVLDALDEHGVPHEWVLGVDPDKLDVVLATTDVAEGEVYDVDERVYAQKTGVDESEKYSRLQGLADRIDDLEGPEGEALREELDDLEDRLEDALSAE